MKGRYHQAEAAKLAALYQAIGHRIRQARDRAGITRPDFAQRARMGASPLASYENGDRPPSMAVLFRIAWALEIEPRELIPTNAEVEREMA